MDNQEILTPPEWRAIAQDATNKLIPPKSESVYEKENEKFIKWFQEKAVIKISENVLIAYFEHLTHQTYKWSTLWKSYSTYSSLGKENFLSKS